MTRPKNIEVLFVAGFGPIVRDPAASRKFYSQALGLPVLAAAVQRVIVQATDLLLATGHAHELGGAAARASRPSPRSTLADARVTLPGLIVVDDGCRGGAPRMSPIALRSTQANDPGRRV